VNPLQPANHSWPEAALREAGLVLRLEIADRHLIRVGHCAIFALPNHRLIARVARPDQGAERLEAEIAFARFLHRSGLPVVPPADEVAEHPIETRMGAVTFWPLVESTGRKTDWQALGGVLRRIHSLTPPDGMVSLWDPVGRVAARLESYRSRPNARAEYVQVLSAGCWWGRWMIGGSDPATLTLVHGDPTNVIMAADGLVLIDFDLCGLGPPLWDVASVAVRQRRFGLSLGDLEGFYGAYHFDAAASRGFEDLVRLRELLDCSFALEAAGDSGSVVDQELEIRIRALRDPTDRSRWTPRDQIPTAD